jgi:DNA polymerase-1
LEQVDKKMRFVGKNKFVFPEFYGAGAFSIAANTGLPIQQVERVENEFYGMYSGVSRWQEMKWDEYQKYGYVTTPLGFRRRGPLEYTQVVNTPIQATAFHALLDALIRATAEFRRLKLRSKMVLQVHDSILIDTVASEHDLVMEIINEYTSDKALWKWCTGARLNVDWQKGSNWLDMEELKAA